VKTILGPPTEGSTSRDPVSDTDPLRTPVDRWADSPIWPAAQQAPATCETSPGTADCKGAPGRSDPCWTHLCLGTTQRGEPRHLLYVTGDTQLFPWVPVRPESDSENADLKAPWVFAGPVDDGVSAPACAAGPTERGGTPRRSNLVRSATLHLST